MRTIKINPNGIGRYGDSSAFPVGELVLSLQGVPTYAGEFRFVALCNGETVLTQTVTAQNNTVTIPQAKLKAGTFSCHVLHYVNGQKVKRFAIEDLIIIEVDDAYRAYPQIATLEQSIADLQEKCTEHDNQLTEVKTLLQQQSEALQSIKEKLSAFLESYIEGNPFAGAEEAEILEELQQEV